MKLKSGRRNLPANDIHVDVLGSYQPETIEAMAGVPVRIVFRREENSPCSEQIVFPAIGTSATLPPGRDVVVELPAQEPGEYEFRCGMGMLRGRLLVTAPEVTAP